MKDGDREQLGTAIGICAGLNAALLLSIAWAMAVQRGFSARDWAKIPDPEAVEETLLVITAEPESPVPAPEELKPAEPEPPPPPQAKPERQFVNAAPGQEAEMPDRKDPRFFSSQNMRAASEEDASPEGKEGWFTNKASGDRPRFDLRDSDFKEGNDPSPSPPPAPGTPPPPLQASASPSLPPPSKLPPPALTTPGKSGPMETPEPDRPLEPAKAELADIRNLRLPPPDRALLDPVRAKTAEEEEEEEEEAETEKPADKPPEAAPLAFQDQNSNNLSPVPDPPPRPAARAPQQPRPKANPAASTAKNAPPATGRQQVPVTPPPALTRIPDRVPNYNPGLTTAKSLGKITNKGNSSVDAEETAEGRYGKSIRSAIEKNWRPRLASLAGFANPGLVEVEFDIDAKGRISGVKLMNPGEANPIMQDCALTAIINAKLPPPPAELLDTLDPSMTGARMRRSFSFLTY